MTHGNPFVISCFENRKGVISWRVSGSLYGMRIRKNLNSKQEAAAENAMLEVKAQFAETTPSN